MFTRAMSPCQVDKRLFNCLHEPTMLISDSCVRDAIYLVDAYYTDENNRTSFVLLSVRHIKLTYHCTTGENVWNKNHKMKDIWRIQ